MQIEQETAVAVEDITCVYDCRMGPGLWWDLTILLIVVAGGLLFARWRDTLFVGLVGITAYFAIPLAIGYFVDGYFDWFSWFGLPGPHYSETWLVLGISYVTLVVIAAAAHAVRRGVLYVTRQRPGGSLT